MVPWEAEGLLPIQRTHKERFFFNSVSVNIPHYLELFLIFFLTSLILRPYCVISEPSLLLLDSHSQHNVFALQAWIPIPIPLCYFSDEPLLVMLQIERQCCSHVVLNGTQQLLKASLGMNTLEL